MSCLLTRLHQHQKGKIFVQGVSTTITPITVLFVFIGTMGIYQEPQRFLSLPNKRSAWQNLFVGSNIGDDRCVKHTGSLHKSLRRLSCMLPDGDAALC